MKRIVAFFKFFESTLKSVIYSLFDRTFLSTAVTGLTKSVPFIASPSRTALKNKNVPEHAVTSAVLWLTMKEAHSISNIHILEAASVV